MPHPRLPYPFPFPLTLPLPASLWFALPCSKLLPRCTFILRAYYVRVAELGPKSNLGRLNSVMKNIGRNVKNSAVVAVERIGAGIHGKVRGREGTGGAGRVLFVVFENQASIRGRPLAFVALVVLRYFVLVLNVTLLYNK